MVLADEGVVPTLAPCVPASVNALMPVTTSAMNAHRAAEGMLDTVKVCPELIAEVTVVSNITMLPSALVELATPLRVQVLPAVSACVAEDGDVPAVVLIATITRSPTLAVTPHVNALDVAVTALLAVPVLVTVPMVPLCQS